MCCHLVSFSESCLASFLNTRPMETSVTPDFQRSQHCCDFRNKTGWSSNQPTYHLHIMLLFIKYICSKRESFSQRASPLHVRALLPSPSPFHPRRGFIFQFNAIRQQPSSHTNASYFHCNLSMSLLWGFARAGRLFGFRKEKTRQLPKTIGGWETMARPVWFSLLLEPQTSSLL